MTTIDRASGGTMVGLRTRSPREVAFRVAEGIRFARERFRYARHSMGLEADLESASDLLPLTLFASFKDKGETRRLWMERFPESVQRSISLADGILQNRIPLFSEITDFGEAIDWHQDYRSLKRAPLRFYRDLHTIDPGDIGDAKDIWELNRQNFLLHLAKAYLATSDAKYYEKWKDVVRSWIVANPYNAGINWESSIELAIRAINWIWSSYFFSEEIAKERTLQETLYRTLFLHGHHIENHLSYYFSPNTHLTAEALGLLYLGRAFPSLKGASRWVSRGSAILDHELDRQVLEDGGYFEMATYYHKYTIDFYVHYLLLIGADQSARPDRASKIKRLVKHLMLLSEPDGTIPLLGDSDGGELLSLGSSKRSMAGSCCAAAVLLGDEELASLCDPAFLEEALWLTGGRGLEKFGELRKDVRQSAYNSFNAATGLFCFRTGLTKNDSYITIDCGPHGWGACGHAHADLLSYEWYCKGTKVVTDPGTYTYQSSKELRDALRSSQRHNTITINGISQSIPDDTFKWKTVAHPRYAFARAFEGHGFFEGEHDAYESTGCRHARALVSFDAELVVIMDFIKASKPVSSLLCNLQCGEGAVREVEKGLFQFDGAHQGKSYGIKFLGTCEHDLAVEDGTIHPDYNEIVPALRIELTGRNVRGDQLILTVLGEDIGLVRSFDFINETCIAGRSPTKEYAISYSMRGPRAGTVGVGGAISVFVRGQGETRMMLRNSHVVTDSSNTVRFESAAPTAFCAAIIRDRTLFLSIDDVCRSFSVPDRIDTVILNGKPTPFKLERGILTVDTP